MDCKQSLHMNPGEGETSYARNSSVQKALQDKIKTMIEEAVAGFFAAMSTPILQNMVVADLGCSSGPNALALVSTAVDAIRRQCVQSNAQLPAEISLFLNDLPGNDFNTVAKSLAALKVKDTSKYFTRPAVMTGMIPGSFYDRLFARDSLHFVCSSSSLQWLSEPPEDLKKSGIPMYDCDEHLRLSRRQTVDDAYARQFRNDFTQFLTMRAEELVPRGRMVISLLTRCSDIPDLELTQPWKWFLIALSDMALRGVISKEMIDSFHIPVYCPLDKQVKEIIRNEGSFEINKVLIHDMFGGMDKALINPKTMALWTRAAFEPIMVQHFEPSKEIMDEFMTTLERHLSCGGQKDMLAPENPLKYMCLLLTKVK